jgi:hypothetical protein
MAVEAEAEGLEDLEAAATSGAELRAAGALEAVAAGASHLDLPGRSLYHQRGCYQRQWTVVERRARRVVARAYQAAEARLLLEQFRVDGEAN